ncbi:MAG: glycerol kinase GlpK [Candidatus Hodarchaeales archaeon]|jgi:glycerol kinase
MNFILAIDQGTTSSRAIVFNDEGIILSQSQKEHSQIYPKAGYVEHKADEIWNNIEFVCNKAVKQVGNWDKIKTIGLTNQRETLIAWDNETGNPLGNAIVWQCRRSTDIVNTLIKEGYHDLFHKKTGLVLDAYFSGTKIRWLLENSNSVKKAAKNKRLRFGTVDSFLIFKMSGKHVTDVSNASRTLLFDLKSKTWSQELLEILKVPDWTLPEVIPSVNFDPKGCYWERNNNRIPILGIAGDQQSALFGQTAFKKGENKITYGTGNFALLNTGNNIQYSKNGLLSTVGWAIEDVSNITYALEGSVFITGALIQWLRDELQIISSVDEIEYIARQTANIGPLVIVPAFVGLGAPYWNQNARGTIFGLTRGTNRNHLVKAALESIALQTYDIIELLERECKIKIESIKVDGGASQNDYLMELQASILQKNVIRPRNIETTAMGAALLAGLGAEFWTSLEELRGLNPPEKIFQPDFQYPQEYKLKLWSKAIERSLNWI